MSDKENNVKKPTMLQAVIPLFGLLICLGGGYAIMGLPTQVFFFIHLNNYRT